MSVFSAAVHLQLKVSMEAMNGITLLLVLLGIDVIVCFSAPSVPRSVSLISPVITKSLGRTLWSVAVRIPLSALNVKLLFLSYQVILPGAASLGTRPCRVACQG